jgi:hypothetical protein
MTVRMHNRPHTLDATSCSACGARPGESCKLAGHVDAIAYHAIGCACDRCVTFRACVPHFAVPAFARS